MISSVGTPHILGSKASGAFGGVLLRAVHQKAPFSPDEQHYILSKLRVTTKGLERSVRLKHCA